MSVAFAVDPLWVAIGVAVAAYLVGDLISRVSKQRTAAAELPSTWGQQLRTDRSDRPFDRWYRKVPREVPASYELDDQTWADLEFDSILAWLDRTQTALGAQILYTWLRHPRLDRTAVARRIALADNCTANEAERVALQTELSRPGDRVGWDAAILVTDPGPMPWGPKWIYDALAYAFVAPALAGVLLQNIAFVAMGLMLAMLNPLLHYAATQQTAGHLEGLRALRRLISVAERLAAALPADARKHFEHLSDDLEVARKAVKVKGDSGGSGGSPLAQAFTALIEYRRAFFLTEVRAYINTLAGVAEHRDALVRVLSFIGEVDAAISLAHLREHEQGWCEVGVTEDDASVVATGLVHPLLLEDGVPNDVTLGPRSLLITGSNMAGKSTFLRTIGANLVLAQTMGLACAQSFRCKKLRIVASMQAHDDLGGSVSLYQAEVLRIRTLLEQGQGDPPCLALLDEVFRGTNPSDRVAASGAVLLELAKRNVAVAATHDLALVDLTAERFDVAHFTERADEDGVVFDYLLSPGISRRTNALSLLQRLGYPEHVVAHAEAIAASLDPAGPTAAR